MSMDGRAGRRFREMVFGMRQADVIFIHIGENDVLQGAKADDVVRHIYHMVNGLRGPGTVVYV